jgi:hypothetical protein
MDMSPDIFLMFLTRYIIYPSEQRRSSSNGCIPLNGLVRAHILIWTRIFSTPAVSHLCFPILKFHPRRPKRSPPFANANIGRRSYEACVE